jgi:hypothetical protein
MMKQLTSDVDLIVESVKGSDKVISCVFTKMKSASDSY